MAPAVLPALLDLFEGGDTVVVALLDGEWTRRRVPSVEWAHNFANKLGIPSYDAAVVGYPPRMREYNARMKKNGLA